MDFNSIKVSLGLMSPDEHRALLDQQMAERVAQLRSTLPAVQDEKSLRSSPVQVMQRVPTSADQAAQPAGLAAPAQAGNMTPSEYMDWKIRQNQGVR